MFYYILKISIFLVWILFFRNFYDEYARVHKGVPLHISCQFHNQ